MRTEACDDQVRRSELRMYLTHLRGLWPGAKVPVFDVHPGSPGDISGWGTDDCQVLVDEGRRQLDAQRDQTEQIRSRSQFLFTTCLGLAAVSFAGRSTVFAAKSDVPLGIWALGLLDGHQLDAYAEIDLRNSAEPANREIGPAPFGTGRR